MTADLIYNKLAEVFTGGSIRQLEKKLGFTNGAIGKAIARKSIIKPAVRDQILKHFPTVNKYWMQTGDGEMLLEKIEKNQENGTTLDNKKDIMTMYTNTTTAAPYNHSQAVYDTINDLLKRKLIKVADVAEETRLPAARLYKWFDANSTSRPVKAADIAILENYINKQQDLKKYLQQKESSKQAPLISNPSATDGTAKDGDTIPLSKYAAMLEKHYEDLKATKDDLQHTKNELLSQQSQSIAAINILTERNSLFEGTLGAIKDIVTELKSMNANSTSNFAVLENIGRTVIGNQHRLMHREGIAPFPLPAEETDEVMNPASSKVSHTVGSK
jgi:hypothetical protein